MTIFGWDMSHFDAPSIGTALAEGIAFVTHKAGGDADDGELGAWWSGVRGLDQNKVLLGAYWVLYPGNPTNRAFSFLARLNTICPGWQDRPFLLQVDSEKWNGDARTVPPLADIRAFCGTLVSAMPKLRPVVYAPKWVYGDSLTGLGYPLWASSYVTGSGGFKGLYPGDSDSRWGAYSGQTPAILQYSSSAIVGGQDTSDANAYRGTFTDLMALVAPGWSNDMPLTPADIAAVADAVWARPLANPYSKVGQPAGDLLRYAPSATGIAAYVDAKLAPQFAAVLAALAAQPQADVTAIVAGILAGLPPSLAKQVADELAARLQA